MEPETIGIIVSVLAIINLAFLSVFKVVFTYAVNYESQLKKSTDRKIARNIVHIFENRPLFTAIVSVGKSVSSAILSISFYLLFNQLLESNYVPIATIVTVVLILSFPAYTIPKAVVTTDSVKYLRVCYYAYQINRIFLPIAFAMAFLYTKILNVRKFDEKLSFLSEEEKERFTGDSEHGDMLDHDEQEMIRNIFEFGDTTVREIMVPRIDMTALNIDTEFNEVLRVIYEEGHSRIPIYSDNIDTVVGILYTKDILRWISTMDGNFNPAEWDMNAIMIKPYFVPLNKKLDDLMTEMKANQSHLVVVVDEYGGTAGICSLEDILEEIVGEIRDEYDEHENEVIQQVDQNTYIVNSHMELDDLEERIGIKLEFGDVEYSTVGGLFYHEFGDVPDEGTTFDFQGLTLTVIKMDHQRIGEIKITILNKVPAE